MTVSYTHLDVYKRQAPLGFKLFHQVGGFQDRQLAQFFHDVSDVSHITFLSLVSSSTAATVNFSSRPANRRFTLLLFVTPLRKFHGTEIVYAFSDFALMTCANCDAGVLIKIASFVAGATSRPRIFARKTSSPGKSAKAMMPASSRRWLFK